MIRVLNNRATSGVQGLVPYVPGKPIDELAREYGLTHIVKLASNENPLGPSPKLSTVLHEAMLHLTRYPDGSGHRLKTALAHQLDVALSQITLGNGSNDVLELVARTFASVGDEIIYSQYAFAVYPLITQAIGAKPVVVAAQSWGHDLTAIIASISAKTKLIFIANPNNPTGTYLSLSSIVNFLEQVPSDVIVVIDEAYHEYAVSVTDYGSVLACLANYPNLVVTRTFSKAYGLAGLRVGFSVSHPDMAELVNRVRQPFNVNALALVGAEAVLSDSEYVARAVAMNQQGLDYLSSEIQRLGLAVIPSVANFITLDLSQPALPVYEQLLRQGVIVRPVANYGMPNHLRVSVGLPEENQVFVRALEQVLSELR